jgi:hypothetical protein
MSNMYRFGFKIIVFAALFTAAVTVSAVANTGIDFNIRFFDRRIYYAETDPVYVQATITNNSPSTYRFKLADERAFSIDFDVRTATNRPLSQADSLIRKRTQYQQVFFREIAVESGESFSFVEALRDYVRLSDPGSFVVTARIYPELYRSELNSTVSTNSVNMLLQELANGSGIAVPVLESKRLTLNIRPPVIPGPDGVPLELDVATGAVLARERLAPDQVVDYMITARQKSQWERFFLYLDLEAMLSRDAVRRRAWIAESEAGRRRMIDLYSRELRNNTTDGTISVIPTEYAIEQTQYSNSEGTVTVLQRFKTGNFTEIKRYIYQLQRKDDIWSIVDYSVINLGTE